MNWKNTGEETRHYIKIGLTAVKARVWRLTMVREILIDESAGIYIPRNFYRHFNFDDWGLKLCDYSELSDPDNDAYWDAWDDLCRHAEHTDKTGTVWRLEQDGDLWAIRDDDEVSDETD